MQLNFTNGGCDRDSQIGYYPVFLEAILILTLPRLAGEDPEGYEIEASFVRSVDLVE